MAERRKAIALLSGGGTTMENLFTHIDEHGLPIDIDLVVASRPSAYGLTRARNRSVETAVVHSKEFRTIAPFGQGMTVDWDLMSDALNEVILPREPELVLFCGFMCLYLLPKELQGKTLNIHPALIPSFCGTGMFGHRVHEAVVQSGVKVTGCTVHFVTNEYDAGPIIVQRTCPVRHDDTPEDVAARVFREECIAYPEAIRLFAEDRLRLVDNVVHVLD